MTARGHLLSRALTALAVAAAALVGISAAPAAADPGSCTPTLGVVVAVDFRPFGGGIERGCDATPTTGLEALHTAGFSTVGTQHDGPAFVCRIKGLPTAAADPCVVTPPSTRYWSYWHADPGQSGWSYSQLGAASYRPKAGSVDAWVYGATDTGGGGGGPSFSPSSVRATAPAAAPSPTSSTGPAGGTGGGGGGSGGGAGGVGGSSGGGGSGGSGGSAGSGPGGAVSPRSATKAPTPTASSAAPAAPGASAAPVPGTTSTSPTTAPTTSTTSSASTSTSDANTSTTDPPVTDVRAAPTSAPTATGSVWPTVGVIALVLAMAGTALIVALRRRRAET